MGGGERYDIPVSRASHCGGDDYHLARLKVTGHWSYKRYPYCTDVIRYIETACVTRRKDQPQMT